MYTYTLTLCVLSSAAQSKGYHVSRPSKQIAIRNWFINIYYSNWNISTIIWIVTHYLTKCPGTAEVDTHNHPIWYNRLQKLSRGRQAIRFHYCVNVTYARWRFKSPETTTTLSSWQQWKRQSSSGGGWIPSQRLAMRKAFRYHDIITLPTMMLCSQYSGNPRVNTKQKPVATIPCKLLGYSKWHRMYHTT